MTNEFAIEILKGDNLNRCCEEEKEALDMAIKALEQPTVTEFADKCRECGKMLNEKMRDATAEEQKSTHDYIKSISKPTGLQFDDVVEEIDFVQEHPRIKTELRVCEDCISRAEALKAIENEKMGWDGTERYAIDECHSRIMELPSVKPNLKWIPVTEKLPERDVNVLAYCHSLSFDYQRVAWIDDYYGEWVNLLGAGDKVIAWQPLPEPYDGGKKYGQSI